MMYPIERMLKRGERTFLCLLSLLLLVSPYPKAYASDNSLSPSPLKGNHSRLPQRRRSFKTGLDGGRVAMNHIFELRNNQLKQEEHLFNDQLSQAKKLIERRLNEKDLVEEEEEERVHQLFDKALKERKTIFEKKLSERREVGQNERLKEERARKIQQRLRSKKYEEECCYQQKRYQQQKRVRQEQLWKRIEEQKRKEEQEHIRLLDDLLIKTYQNYVKLYQKELQEARRSHKKILTKTPPDIIDGKVYPGYIEIQKKKSRCPFEFGSISCF